MRDQVPLHLQAGEPERVHRAWAEVFSGLTPSVHDRAELDTILADVDGFIAQVSRSLQSADYVPDSLRPARIPSGEGIRRLSIPSLRDRVAERALYRPLERVLDPLLGPFSFAYRSGHSVSDAVRCAAEARDQGMGFALRTDILACFESISLGLVAEQLDRAQIDGATIDLIMRFAGRKLRGGQRAPNGSGLAQGSPLSPLLANLALAALDHRLAKEGLTMIRYADDILIPVVSRADADTAQHLLQRAAAGLGLALNERKTFTSSFEEGFTFLGEYLDADSPTASERRVSPSGDVVYVSRAGAMVAARKGRLVVTRGGEELLSLPQSQVKRVVTFGPVAITAGARQWALNAGIDLVILSARGKFLGSLCAPTLSSVSRRIRQYDASRDPLFARALASRFVSGKIANSKALLMRYRQGSTSPALIEVAIERLRRSFIEAGSCSHGSVMGVEGAAAAAYWEAFGTLLPAECSFVGRRRRPPPDPVNGALSLLYTLLTTEATGALIAAGCEAGLGVLHTAASGRASLALDLIEEFRPVVVDTIVLDMARRGMLSVQSVERSDVGIRFTNDARSTLFRRYEARMLTLTGGLLGHRRLSYRAALHAQARNIARCLDTGTVDYEALRWRS